MHSLRLIRRHLLTLRLLFAVVLRAHRIGSQFILASSSLGKKLSDLDFASTSTVQLNRIEHRIEHRIEPKAALFNTYPSHFNKPTSLIQAKIDSVLINVTLTHDCFQKLCFREILGKFRIGFKA